MYPLDYICHRCSYNSRGPCSVWERGRDHPLISRWIWHNGLEEDTLKGYVVGRAWDLSVDSKWIPPSSALVWPCWSWLDCWYWVVDKKGYGVYGGKQVRENQWLRILECLKPLRRDYNDLAQPNYFYRWDNRVSEKWLPWCYVDGSRVR